MHCIMHQNINIPITIFLVSDSFHNFIMPGDYITMVFDVDKNRPIFINKDGSFIFTI